MTEKEINIQAEDQTLKVDQSLFNRLVKTLSEHKLQAEIIGGVVVFSAVTAAVTAIVKHQQHREGSSSRRPETPFKLSPEKEEEYLSKMFTPNYDYILRSLQYMKGSRIDRETAEDLAQVTFLKIYKTFDRFVPEPGVPDPYRSDALKVAGNLLINYYRDSSRHIHSSLDQSPKDDEHTERDGPYDHLPDPNLSPEKLLLQKQELAVYRQAYSHLISIHQLVLWLDNLELTNPEIGNILGKSEGAVKSLKFRANSNIQKNIDRINKTHV